jgi:hypothetical protein
VKHKLFAELHAAISRSIRRSTYSIPFTLPVLSLVCDVHTSSDLSRMKIRNVIILIARCTFALACGLLVGAGEAATLASHPQQSPGKSAIPSRVANNISRLLQEIQGEIGEADCAADDQCHSIGVGERPCGGPEAWLAWSSKVSDRDRLTALVTEHRDARRQENARSGLMSNCRAMPDPGAVCGARMQDGKRICQPGQGTRDRVD